jgi:hypothetical protein
MADPIVPDLLDLFPFTVTVIPVTRDGFGKKTLGTPFTVPAMINGKTQQVQTTKGLLTSDLEVIVGGDFQLTADNHVYTLPTRFKPGVEATAMHVHTESDENNVHHQVVFF